MSGIGRKQRSGPEYSKVPLWVDCCHRYDSQPIAVNGYKTELS